MKRTSLSLAGGLATALLLVSTPAAQAAVGAKDVPSQGDIVKAFPELADGQFTTEKAKKISGPGKKCGVPNIQKAKSAVNTTAISADGTTIVVAGAAEVATAAKAKAYVASYKKYVKKCATFTEPTSGATFALSLGRSPKVGDSSVTVVQQTTIGDVTSYSTSVVLSKGKRVGSVAAIDDTAVSASAIKKLAKVAAKKIK